MQLFFHAQVAQENAGVRFGRVAAHFAVFRLQFASAHAVFFGEVFLGIDSVALMRNVPELFIAHKHRVEYGYLVELVVVLFEDRHALAGVISTEPLFGSISPDRILRKVDLPAPLAPITP